MNVRDVAGNDSHLVPMPARSRFVMHGPPPPLPG